MQSKNKTKILGCTKQGEIPCWLGDFDFYIHPVSILSGLMKWYGFILCLAKKSRHQF
jgi:hypothetical protein